MKVGFKVLMNSLLVLGVMGIGAHEKKVVFKKKICAQKKKTLPQKASASVSSDNYITVWIHGVNLFTPNQYNLGLCPAYTFIENESLFGIGRHLVESDPIRFPADNVLMYSWPASFKYNECEKAAAKLYESLLKAVKEYTVRNNAKPRIRIITFSYGGNIAFNLSKVQGAGKGLIIDELILLGWPVQKIFVPMMKDPMFKKIFNIYSPLDLVQIIDPQGFYFHHGSAPLFTGRRIARAANVLQAKVHLNGRGCGHFGLNSQRFVSVFPQVLDQMNDWFGYCQENNLGLKKTHCIFSIYTDKSKATKRKQK